MEAALRRILERTENSHLEGSAPSAAVALILAGPEHELLLIRRAEDPRDPWSGHVALPGGRHERTDGSLLRTAIRETLEEVGVSLTPQHCVGPLPLTQARSRSRQSLLVAPFVFHIPGLRPSTTMNHEVADVIWIPLRSLNEEGRATFLSMDHQGSSYRFPAWGVGDGRIVWGLTYAIVSGLLPIYQRALVDVTSTNIASTKLASTSERPEPPPDPDLSSL